MQLNNKYFKDTIKNNPLLTRKQEIDLARKMQKGDSFARKKLIESNYRLVLSIAKKYHRSYIDFEDLVQESSVGLIKAADKFDPELGHKFSTYACWWIKQAALQYINENTSNIKVPTHSRLLNAKIKAASEKLSKEKGLSPTLKELSEEVGENVKKIKYTINANKNISSIDANINDSGYSIANKVQDDSLFVDPEKNYERKELNRIVLDSLKLLTPKEEKIIRLRFGITESENNLSHFVITDDMKEYLNEK